MPDFNFDAIMAKLAGVAGALVSMQFLKGPWPTRLAMATAGALLSYYASAYVSVKTGLPEGLSGFLLGFFGMAVVSKAWEWLQVAPLGEWFTQVVKGQLDKWWPPKQSGNQDGK